MANPDNAYHWFEEKSSKWESWAIIAFIILSILSLIYFMRNPEEYKCVPRRDSGGEYIDDCE